MDMDTIIGDMVNTGNPIPQNDAGESWDVFNPMTAELIFRFSSEERCANLCDVVPTLDYLRTGY